MDDEFIQFKGVTKKFGKKTVLDCVDLTIPEGKITGIVGASGEGKTTILKLLMGFYKPNEGQVSFLRRNIMKDMSNIKRIFGFATEDGSFYEKLSVIENLYHFGRLNGMSKSEIKNRSDELLPLVNLHEAIHTFAENLSMGMKKRLEIAISLLPDPTVLILDEPTSDLDPLLRGEIIGLLQKINKNGTTIIFTSQLLHEMDAICDQIAILYDAKIIEQGSPSKIRSKYNASDMDVVFTRVFSKRMMKRWADRENKHEVTKRNVKVRHEKEQGGEHEIKPAPSLKSMQPSQVPPRTQELVKEALRSNQANSVMNKLVESGKQENKPKDIQEDKENKI